MTHLPRSARVLAAGLAGTLLLGTAAACSGDGGDTRSSTTPAPTTSASTPAPTTPAPRPAVDPLTGGTASANGVVAVKIDDTANGRPQRNIDKADIVYIEEVEGGLTRLVGVFHTRLPVVESVRSTRPADPELVSQYGKVAYVASGGARVPLRILDRSFLKTSINDRGGPGFQRENDKPAPYNLSANLKTIAKDLKAPKAKSVGFAWSASTSQLAGAASGTRLETMVGGTDIDFRYDSKTRRYVRYINGTAQKTAAGVTISTPNVLVQLCKVEPFPGDTDVNGNPNQYTHTVGSGSVVLFRDGKRINGTWKRSSITGGTTYATNAGKPIAFKPGGAWVVLTKTGQRVSG